MEKYKVGKVVALCISILLAKKGTPYLYHLVTKWYKEKSPPNVLFSKLLSDLENNEIEQVLVSSSQCLVSKKAETAERIKKYFVDIPQADSSSVIRLLMKHRVNFGALSPSLSSRTISLALTLVPFLYLGLLYKMVRNLYGKSSKQVGKNGRLKTSKSGKKITFDDVAGIDSAKIELEEVVDFLKHPKRYEQIGAKIPKGVLLYGPSGTGKTLLARALAEEAGIPFLFCSASDFVEMLVGRGASRVRQLFTQASEHSRCIIFIDEIDALAKSRGGLHANDEREQTLNQLLTEMDGFDGEQNGAIVIAATNRPNVLDPALRRPGRFDREVYVGYPDVKGREAILRVHSDKIKASPDLDLKKVAAECGEKGIASGAQLAGLVNEAALLAVRCNDVFVKKKHFDMAMEKYESSSSQVLDEAFLSPLLRSLKSNGNSNE